MALRRTGVDWTPIVDLVGTDPSLLDQFNYGPGGRIFATAYNDSDFGIQVGYEGINNYNATALFPQGDDLRSFDYETTFNSIELNVLRRTTAPTKLFAGFRYIQVDEDFTDRFADRQKRSAAEQPADDAVHSSIRATSSSWKTG